MDALLGGSPLLVIGIAVALVLGCLGLAFSGSSAARLKKRAERLAQRARGETPVALSLRRAAEGGFDTVLRRMVPRPELLRQRLVRTGYGWTIGGYVVACLVVLVL